MLHLTYPASPSINDYSFLEPKPTFVKQAWNVTAAILLFLFVYLLLIAAASGIVCLCAMIGILFLGASVNTFTIIIALGLLALSLMFFAFLVKFVFSVKKYDTSDSKEIKREDHPRLFAFIERLADELKAPKPKKIYLIPDVNASVFYNSSFWSMFFPVRKNLNIGLGFVNTVNLSEFKAVLAHEFGHFSQRSMKLGSYVYTVNQVIYNLVYEYDHWDRLLQQWSSSGGLFSIFASLTDLMVTLVRRLLQFLYGIINKRNMGLSREMEYNADLVAVSAAGGNAMISALRKVGFGAAAYHSSIDALNDGLGEKRKIDNFYNLHTAVMHRLAKLNDLEINHGLPEISDAQLKKAYKNGRVVFKDQWASHPDQEDREANILTANIQADIDYSSPWGLFEQPEAVQMEMTDHLYRNVQLEAETTVAKANDFMEVLEQNSAKYSIPEKFNGFYSNRLLIDFNKEEALEHHIGELNFDEIFNDENVQGINAYFSDMQDLATLEQIRDGAIDTTSFDFDGIKHKKKDAGNLAEQLKKEIEARKTWFRELEEKAFCYYHRLAQQTGKTQALLDRYEAYFLLDEQRDRFQPFANEANHYLMLLQNTQRWDEDDARHLVQDLASLRRKMEDALKLGANFKLPQRIGEFTADHSWPQYLVPGDLSSLPSTYFEPESFNTLYFQIHEALNKINKLSIEALLDILRFQDDLG